MLSLTCNFATIDELAAFLAAYRAAGGSAEMAEPVADAPPRDLSRWHETMLRAIGSGCQTRTSISEYIKDAGFAGHTASITVLRRRGLATNKPRGNWKVTPRGAAYLKAYCS